MAEWVMVLVNAIYVVATIFICSFNHQSAKAANEQIKEMKRQYDDEKRWRMLPYFHVKKIDSTTYVNGSDFYFLEAREASETTISKKILFEIENAGHDIAKNICYEWENKEGKGEYISSLPVCGKRIVEILFHAYTREKYRTRASLYIHFEDLLGNKYRQKVIVFFEVDGKDIIFLNTTIEAPQCIATDLEMEKKWK